MRAVIFLAILCAVMALGCSRTVLPLHASDLAQNAMVPDPEPTTVVMHADTDFTTRERRLILNAAKTWRFQTSGMANVLVAFDLDYSLMESVEQASQGHIIIRTEADMEMVKAADAEICGLTGMAPNSSYCPRVLGQINVLGGIHASDAVVMMLVVDRPELRNDKAFTQVVIHEFGHVFGLYHSRKSDDDLMAQGFKSRDKACLRKNDLLDFCRINGCGSVTLYPCSE